MSRLLALPLFILGLGLFCLGLYFYWQVNLFGPILINLGLGAQVTALLLLGFTRTS